MAIIGDAVNFLNRFRANGLLSGFLNRSRMFSSASTNFIGDFEPYVDPIFSIVQRFKQDASPNKINLGIGIYKDERGKSEILDVVRKTEERLVLDGSRTKEYLDIPGSPSFISATLRLVFGDCQDLASRKLDAVQTLSGTGACTLASHVLHKFFNVHTFYYSDPTWPIHRSHLQLMGVKDMRPYKYYDSEKSEVAFEEVLSTFKAAPERSAVFLHGCAHNPTGADFSHQQWVQLAEVFKARNLIPIIDTAYLGFASCSPEEDAFGIREFHRKGIEMMVCVSFSKMMGLYNERTGMLGWYASSESVSQKIRDRAVYVIRNSYSNPPAHGCQIASKILNDSQLREEWLKELSGMAQRIVQMREGLVERLEKLKTPGDWTYIVKQRGLFAFLRLSKEQIEYLERSHKIFMIPNGRINVSALNTQCLDYVAGAIHDAVVTFHGK